MSGDVVLGERTKESIKEIFDLQQMVSLLTSLQRPFPHLSFGMWTQSNPPRRGEFGDITVYKRDRAVLRVRVRLGEGKGIACKVGTLAGVPIPRLDREALRSFADFVGTLVESLSTVSRLAVSQRRRTDILPFHIDIGSLSVARYVWSVAKLRFDPTPMLLHLRSISQQTYENSKISYGVIVSRRTGGRGTFPLDVLENRRYLAVTDGRNTALRLDREGKVLGLMSITEDRYQRDRDLRVYRPRSFEALGRASVRASLAIGLSEHGDIVCLHKGTMVASLSQGQWQVWNHIENAAVLRRAIQGMPHDERRVAEIAHHIYSAALDMSFQRRGGLFVILPSGAEPTPLIDPDQRLEYPDRHISDRGLDIGFVQHDVTKVPREVLCDLASLDGSVILDAKGSCLAYGAIVKLSSEARTSHRGARYQACREASRVGVALMVSSDGSVEIFANQRPLLML